MTQIKLPVKWSVSINNEDLRRYLESQDRLQPYAIIIGAKHAEWLEFGTPPYHNCASLNIHPRMYKDRRLFFKALYSASEFYRSIFDWVRRKAGRDLPVAEQYEFAYKVYTKIASNGMSARPFFRPAFYYMVEHMQDWWDKGQDTEEIANCMREKLEELIMFNFNAPIGSEYMPDTGTLQMSIYQRKLDPMEATQALIERHDIVQMSDDIWEEKSKTQGKGDL